MRVPVQIISFSCFLLSVTLAQGQDLTCQLNSRIFGANKINPEGKTLFRVGESVEITCAESHWIYGTKETIRSFTCQESGNWDHEPICAEIRCEVPRNQQVYNPDYYFWGNMKLGAVKTYYCMSGYERKAAVAKCTREGWTPKPLCAERMCAAPNIPNANIEGEQRQTYRISSTIQYKCHRGFEPEQPVEITCTDYGWTRIQHCTAKKNFCTDPSVVNGFIYRSSSNEEEIFYTCNTGYKTFSGSWWDSVTCSEGSWSEEPRCIREEECGAFPSVDHIKQNKQIFRHGDTTAFECDPGFKPTQSFIKCVRGEWEKPDCEVDVRCGIPPKVENAFITSKYKELYVDGSSVTYVCRGSFLMNGKNTVFCRSGSWEEAPTCTEGTCPLNTAVDDLMERSPNNEGPFKPGQTLTFSCNRQGLKLIGQREITCQPNGEWSSPFPKCEEVKCVAKLTERMRSDVTEYERTGTEISVRPGRTITLTCFGDGVKLQGRNKITCQSNGEWNVPFPKCIGGKCGPPTNVEFGDTKDMPKKEYDSGETVEYVCFNKYTLAQSRPYSKHLTCDNGEWTGNIRCLKPCSVTVEEMDERGIELRWRGREKIFSPHEDRITFKCQWRKYSTGIDLVQTCNDGVMNLPLCE